MGMSCVNGGEVSVAGTNVEPVSVLLQSLMSIGMVTAPLTISEL